MKLWRVIVALVLFPAAYLGACFMLMHLHVNGRTILERTTGDLVEPGGWGQALRKFREVERVGKVDLLFLGSSHAYRGFDPRVFAAAGYRSFNLGTTSQTPLNSYFLLKRYFGRLRPRLVVLEVYPLLLSTDGIECFFDLSRNIPASRELVEMALALQHPQAIHVLVADRLRGVEVPLETVRQREIDHERYVAGGYCETLLSGRQGAFASKPFRVSVAPEQVGYLRRIIRYVHRQGAEVLLVTQPLPEPYLEAMENYRDVARLVGELARQEKVSYLDYNATVRFDPQRDFYDDDHLTAPAVRRYNRMLIRDLAGIRW